MMKTIAINGSTGFIGQTLCSYFTGKYRVIRILRNDYLIDPVLLAYKIESADIVINIAGASISKRWSSGYRNLIFSSRIDTTRNLVNALKLLKKKPELFISASAIGIYDDLNDHTDASLLYRDDFLANVCKRWEEEACIARSIAIPTTIVRFGVVLGNNGGILSSMVLPFRFGLGAILGNGQQNMSIIHIEDLLRAMTFIIDQPVGDVVNFVSPEYVSNLDFSRQLAIVLHRPLFLKIPAFLVRLVMSDQSELLLGSKRVVPNALLKNGFRFNFNNSFDALKNLIQKR